MKTITAVFLIAQILDVLTTVIGIQLPGVFELHPAGFGERAILAKIAASAGIALILQIRQWSKAAWLIPGVASLPPIWNLVVILFELLH